jgi:probable F420-dependent oxidoreductase
MVDYLDQLDAGGVPAERRILAALGPWALQLAADRTLGTHPYLVVPSFTRDARQLLGPDVVIAPEHTVVLETNPDIARGIGRPFVADPISSFGTTRTTCVATATQTTTSPGGGSDRLIDALVLHGSIDAIAAGLHAHLDAGADHVAIQVLPAAGHDPMRAYQRLAHSLL